MSDAPVYYNFTRLFDEIQTFSQRNDAKFISQIPVFIANAENRLAIMIKNLGQLQALTLSPVTQIIAKPNRWHVSTSFSVTDTETGEINYLFEKTFEYIKLFQSELTQLYPTKLPQYYGDYDFDHFIITPWLPDLASNWVVELLYYERPEPLSEQNQTSWWTSYAPQALLYACLREAALWARMPDRSQELEMSLQMEIANINKEDVRRYNDRSYNTQAPLV